MNKMRFFALALTLLMVISSASAYAASVENNAVTEVAPSINTVQAESDINDEDIYYSKPHQVHVVTDNESGMIFVNDELLITMTDGTNEDDVEAIIGRFGGQIVGKIALADEYQVRFIDSYLMDELNELAAAISSDAHVEYVSLNFVVNMGANSISSPVDNSPSVGKEYLLPEDDWGGSYGGSWNVEEPAGNNWGMEAIHAPYAWAYRDEMTPIKIGLIDAGFDLPHPDLNFEWVKNITTRDYLLPINFDIHGNHVAGTMAAEWNHEGVSGVMPTVDSTGNRLVTLYGVTQSEFYSYDTTQDGFELLLAFEMKCSLAELIVRGVKIINNSQGFNWNTKNDNEEPQWDDSFWTGNQISQKAKDYVLTLAETLERFLSKALENGYDFVIVVSAGNDSNHSNGRHINAFYNNPLCAIDDEKVKDHIIVVGSIGMTEKGKYYVSQFSNVGRRVDLVAPGEKIYSCYNTYHTSLYSSKTASGGDFSGTSMAAPHVSGVAAMVWSVNPDLTGEEVKEIVVWSADRSVECAGYIYNILNAENAVEEAIARKKDTFTDETNISDPNLGVLISTVVDSQDVPIPGAGVYALSGESDSSYYTTTDASGQFEMFLPEGYYEVFAQKGGYPQTDGYGLMIEHGQVNYSKWTGIHEDDGYIILYPKSSDNASSNPQENNAYGNITNCCYADFDCNGTTEGFFFADSGANYENLQLYFVDDTDIIHPLDCYLDSEALYDYGSEWCYVTDNTGKGYYRFDWGGGGSAWKTAVYTVEGTVPYLCTYGIQGFYWDDQLNCFYTTENEFAPEGGHLYPRYKLVYNKTTHSFYTGDRIVDEEDSIVEETSDGFAYSGKPNIVEYLYSDFYEFLNIIGMEESVIETSDGHVEAQTGKLIVSSLDGIIDGLFLDEECEWSVLGIECGMDYQCVHDHIMAKGYELYFDEQLEYHEAWRGIPAYWSYPSFDFDLEDGTQIAIRSDENGLVSSINIFASYDIFDEAIANRSIKKDTTTSEQAGDISLPYDLQWGMTKEQVTATLNVPAEYEQKITESEYDLEILGWEWDCELSHLNPLFLNNKLIAIVSLGPDPVYYDWDEYSSENFGIADHTWTVDDLMAVAYLLDDVDNLDYDAITNGIVYEFEKTVLWALWIDDDPTWVEIYWDKSIFDGYRTTDYGNTPSQSQYENEEIIRLPYDLQWGMTKEQVKTVVPMAVDEEDYNDGFDVLYWDVDDAEMTWSSHEESFACVFSDSNLSVISKYSMPDMAACERWNELCFDTFGVEDHAFTFDDLMAVDHIIPIEEDDLETFTFMDGYVYDFDDTVVWALREVSPNGIYDSLFYVFYWDKNLYNNIDTLRSNTISEVKSVLVTSDVNVRKGPGKSYDILCSLSEGVTIEYLNEAQIDERQVTWYKISINGSAGWVSSALTRIVGGNVNNPQPTEIVSDKEMYVTNCKEWVSLRQGPDQDTERLAKVSIGTRVQFISYADNGYIYCCYNGINGYIYSEYLSDTSLSQLVNETNYVSGMRVRATGDAHVRTGAGLNYDSLGVLEKDNYVTFLNERRDDERPVTWYKIEFKGQTGWISSVYSEIVP